MKHYDYLIIGGGIAGVTAAETIRERDPKGSIAIISKEPHLLYSRVLLPSYIKGRVKRGQVFMRKAEDFDSKNIHFFANETAIAVRPETHAVELESGRVFSFKKLLIASGGRVRKFPQGEGLKGIYRLQGLDDSDAMFEALPRITKAVVLGSGFIALEFLEIFSLRKIPTTLVMPHERFFRNLLSAEGSALLHKNFEDHGIEVISNDALIEVMGNAGTFSGIRTASGREIPADALGIGIGIERELDVIQGSGILTGERGVRVNAYLETNIPQIYAAGDAAEFDDLILGHPHALGNWNNAFLQGKTAGKTMAGERTEFRNVANYSITSLGLYLSAIGEAHASLDSVVRHQPGSMIYGEFFLREGKLKGAFLINQPKAQTLVQRWIQEGKDLGSRKTELRDHAIFPESLD